MIYIDGGHTYEEVYEDLISYYTLLKGPKFYVETIMIGKGLIGQLKDLQRR